MSPVTLAVFDLDGTITRRDTLLPFVLGYLRRAPWRFPGLLLVVPAVVAFVLGLSDRGALKSAFIRRTLGGVSRTQITQWTAEFVPALLASGVFADALEAISRHRAQGARLALLSASTDLYVPAIGAALGFDVVVCTELRWRGDILDGHLVSPNRRGHEKAVCFEALRGGLPGAVTAAYGNAASDLEHLRLADQPLLVNGRRAARRRAARSGVPCQAWH